MNGVHQNDFYSNPQISPRSRHSQAQSLHRQPSRHFDAYNDTMYHAEDPTPRYDHGQRYNDRMAPLQAHYGGYDMNGPSAWNSSGFNQNNHLAALGATASRAKPSGRGRHALPSMWMDQPQPLQPNAGFPAFAGSPIGFSPMRSDQLNADGDEDLIPTAIVIKNIPFAVKKEQLVQVMTEMNLPLPYAFNYHFDNGVFRGLAFANFTTPDETAAVINGMNHLELSGRKLRVEYKKMLPQAERDRIEREKRERRGQLEEQHRPLPQTQLHNQPSLSSLSSHVPATSPSPIAGRAPNPNLDMNDPVTLGYYSKLILFQGDLSQGDVFAFPADVPAPHRTIIHGLAHSLGLHHESHGSGDERRIHIYRNTGNGMSPSNSANAFPLDPNRRQLNRAATTDFTNVRSNEQNFYGGPATQSSGFLGFSESPGGLSVGANLRAAKSFADLRSYSPSPAQSAASFPAGLATNLRFQDYAPASPGSSRSNMTPTTASMPVPDALLNGMGNMNLGSGFGPAGGSPHRLRDMTSWDREVSNTSNPGPIGGHRAWSANHEDQNRNRSQGGSVRQSRGPIPDRGNGFPRGRQNGHQTRGSDELSSPSGVEIVVE